MFACINLLHFSDEIHTALLDCANAFSPRVENTAPGTVVFDLEGLERLFGSYSEIAAKVAEELRARGLEENVAIASNPDAAICAARGFGGITVLNRGTEAKQLGDLPLDVLFPSPEIRETLERWGIRTLGAFAKLPVIQISERLGQEGVHLHTLAQGACSRTLVPHHDTLRFEETLELDYEIRTIEPLTFILSRMLDQLCLRLRTRNLATHEIHLGFGAFARVLNLPLPVQNSKLLTKLLILDLEAHPPKDPIKQIRVEAIPVKPRFVQNGLFLPLSPEPEKLELTLARIAAVVGKENVGSPEIVDTHRPDAFRVKKFGKFEFRNSNFEIKAVQHTIALRLFRPALEATVQLREGIPCWIAFHGVHDSIETASGPWHTSGDWWRNDQWNREEWDIELRDSLYRIYRDFSTNRWYVEGVYD